MRHTLFHIMLLLSLPCICLAQKWQTCSDGTMNARADVKAGKLNIITFGMQIAKKMKDEDYHSFRRHDVNEIFQQYYGISYTSFREYPQTRDSFDMVPFECYNKYMDSVIDARFGENLDNIIQSRVDSMNALEQQNALKFYGSWDRLIDSLLTDKATIALCDTMTGTVAYKLVIDASSNVLSVFKPQSFCPAFENKLKGVIESVKWTTATGIAGKKKAATGTVKFVFRKKELVRFEAYFN